MEEKEKVWQYTIAVCWKILPRVRFEPTNFRLSILDINYRRLDLGLQIGEVKARCVPEHDTEIDLFSKLLGYPLWYPPSKGTIYWKPMIFHSAWSGIHLIVVLLMSSLSGRVWTGLLDLKVAYEQDITVILIQLEVISNMITFPGFD